MKDNKLGGVALIVSAIAGVMVMAVQPSGAHGVMSKGQMEALALLNKTVHGFGIASVALSFLGCLALTRELNNRTRLAITALVAYGFAAGAIMIASSMSGFVAPAVMQKLVAGEPSTELRRLFLSYTFDLNQAFASVYVVGSCVAIVLWSAAILQSRALSRGLGLYGVLLGAVIPLALFSGKLSLDVHGFGLVALLQAIWFVTAGIGLLRMPEATLTA